MKQKTTSLIVRRIDDGSEVSRIKVQNPNERYVERVLRGLLRNLDTNNYYVDDSEMPND